MGIDEFHVDFLCCLLVLLKWSNLSKCFRNLPQSLTSATNTPLRIRWTLEMHNNYNNKNNNTKKNNNSNKWPMAIRKVSAKNKRKIESLSWKMWFLKLFQWLEHLGTCFHTNKFTTLGYLNWKNIVPYHWQYSNPWSSECASNLAIRPVGF